ncbi:MAG: type II secretion system protein GspG [Candidatus Dependentiae bacterium]
MTITQARSAREGFTLMEILIAIAIVAIVTITVGPALLRQAFRGKRDATKVRLQGVKSSVQQYHMDNNSYPEKLRDLVKKPADAKRWDGPYLEQEPRDAWDRRFNYKRTPSGKKPYELYSWGENGRGAPKEEWLSVWDS